MFFSGLSKEIIALLRLVRSLLWRLFFKPSGFGRLIQVSEEGVGMSKLFTYRQELLAVPVGVAGQRFTVKVDGVVKDTQALEASATEAIFKAGPEGATVEITLDYVDAAGNDSADLSHEFVIVDQVPPDAPVGFGGITQTAEENVEDVPDEDPVDEDPVDVPVDEEEEPTDG